MRKNTPVRVTVNVPTGQYRVFNPPGKYVSTGYNVRTGRYDPALDERGGREVVEKREYEVVGYRTSFSPAGKPGTYVDTGYNVETGRYDYYADQTRPGPVYRRIR
jgi:hypothetical protein